MSQTAGYRGPQFAEACFDVNGAPLFRPFDFPGSVPTSSKSYGQSKNQACIKRT